MTLEKRVGELLPVMGKTMESGPDVGAHSLHVESALTRQQRPQLKDGGGRHMNVTAQTLEDYEGAVLGR